MVCVQGCVCVNVCVTMGLLNTGLPWTGMLPKLCDSFSTVFFTFSSQVRSHSVFAKLVICIPFFFTFPLLDIFRPKTRVKNRVTVMTGSLFWAIATFLLYGNGCSERESTKFKLPQWLNQDGGHPVCSAATHPYNILSLFDQLQTNY